MDEILSCYRRHIHTLNTLASDCLETGAQEVSDKALKDAFVCVLDSFAHPMDQWANLLTNILKNYMDPVSYLVMAYVLATLKTKIYCRS